MGRVGYLEISYPALPVWGLIVSRTTSSEVKRTASGLAIGTVRRLASGTVNGTESRTASTTARTVIRTRIRAVNGTVGQRVGQ